MSNKRYTPRFLHRRPRRLLQNQGDANTGDGRPVPETDSLAQLSAQWLARSGQQLSRGFQTLRQSLRDRQSCFQEHILREWEWIRSTADRLRQGVSDALEVFQLHLAAQQHGYALLLRQIPDQDLPLLDYEVIPLTELLPDHKTVRLGTWDIPTHALWVALGETHTALFACLFYLIEHCTQLPPRFGVKPRTSASEPQLCLRCPLHPDPDRYTTVHLKPSQWIDDGTAPTLLDPNTRAALTQALTDYLQPTPSR